jgi:glycosyltransferase involved in cell wall biosynthesis
MQSKSKIRIAVLLASYNGAAHIKEQIESIAQQAGSEISLFVSDDGSTDDTKQIVENFVNDNRFHHVEVTVGPRKGFAANFGSLIANVGDDFDYYAFSDQDDIWLDRKFQRAHEKLSTAILGSAAVYCGRTQIIAEDGSELGFSPLFSLRPSFRNALVQSIAGGNTMVLNRDAMRLMKIASARSKFLVHDWFCYIVVSGAGGTLFYDPVPGVRYRQHENNIIGANNSLRAKITRMMWLFAGRFVHWNALNIEALEKLDDILTHDAKFVVGQFQLARSGSLFKRFAALRNSGVYRQTRLGTISLFVACLFRKL